MSACLTALDIDARSLALGVLLGSLVVILCVLAGLLRSGGAR